VPGLYAGARLSAFSTDLSTAGTAEPPVVVPTLESNVASMSAGPVVQWDSRDDQFYPTKGQYASLSAMFYGGDHNYQIYSLAWNSYHSLDENQILAFRAYFRSADGDVPFYALSQFGLRSDLRGYKSGKYRDRDMFAGQVEYRGLLRDPWGFVAFAGAGEVAPSYGDFNTENILASVGAGLRYRLGKAHPVNLRFDWACGKDGGVSYLSVNEAF
jgi:outer membrane protein assembly factor BamA